MPLLDIDRIERASEAMKNLSFKPMDLFDPRFYPPKNEPLEKVLMYFITMVAMDHRLSRPGKLYKAVIDGEEVKGADLLYRLGMKMFQSNPDFFTPENLSRVTVKDVILWLSIGNASPPDPVTRAMLLNDLGVKILRFFNGDPREIIKLCNGYLRRDDGYGLLDLLRMFKAYSDPVEKKSMLLIKFLSYRGILNVVDEENIRVPVDNHLTRIALRLGLVVLEKHLEAKVLREEEVGFDEDILIRYTVREAYRHLAAKASVNPFHLDDFLWSFGRTVCLRDEPVCRICNLRNLCKAYETRIYLNEHTYYNTWFY
jgi:hypothetical protein